MSRGTVVLMLAGAFAGSLVQGLALAQTPPPSNTHVLLVPYAGYLVPIPANPFNAKDFGARGDGVTNDTTAIQNAINTLRSGMTLNVNNGVYVVTALSLGASNVVLQGSGTIKKQAGNISGANTVALTITGSSDQVLNLSFDATSTPYIASDDDSNDVIQILQPGGSNTVSNVVINGNGLSGSATNGIVIFNSPNNTVASSQVNNVRDNGIYIANNPNSPLPSADGNAIQSNTVDGTINQDCIFVTGSAGTSIAPLNWVFASNNVIAGNTVENCGDSGIESGVFTQGTKIQSNTATSSTNALILIRDAQNIDVSNNIVGDTVANQGAVLSDGVAVAMASLNLTAAQLAAWNYSSDIHDNSIAGNFTRSGVYTNGMGVTVDHNVIAADSLSPNYSAGICFGNLSNLTLTNNTISNVGYGVDFNYSDTNFAAANLPPISNITLNGNTITNVPTGINLYLTSIASSNLDSNTYGNIALSVVKNPGANGNNSTSLSQQQNTYIGTVPLFNSDPLVGFIQ